MSSNDESADHRDLESPDLERQDSEPQGLEHSPAGYPAPAGPYQGGPTPPPEFPPAHLLPTPLPPAHLPATGYPPLVPPVTSEPERPQQPRAPLFVVAVIAAVVGAAVGAGTYAIADHHDGTTNKTVTAANSVVLNGTITAAAARIRPSVVTIVVTNGQSGGTGSGVVIRSDGYVLTNDHVVSAGGSADAGPSAAPGTAPASIFAILNDGRRVNATIVGRDTPDDLAVIKLAGAGTLTAATFARSSDLQVGQAVVAVGAPLGLSDTVTSGIVSNVARPVRAGDNNQAVFAAIQTDAAINPGNSGGPLVDLNGSVVGINSAIATESSGGAQSQSGNIGIGFAIPADEASRIATELIATGKATHAVIGVTVSSTQSADPQSVTQAAGIPVQTVTAGSAADKAGLKVGDRITKLDSTSVSTADALIAAIRAHAPGSTVSITYLRDGKPSSTTVTLDSSSN